MIGWATNDEPEHTKSEAVRELAEIANSIEFEEVDSTTLMKQSRKLLVSLAHHLEDEIGTETFAALTFGITSIALMELRLHMDRAESLEKALLSVTPRLAHSDRADATEALSLNARALNATEMSPTMILGLMTQALLRDRGEEGAGREGASDAASEPHTSNLEVN